MNNDTTQLIVERLSDEVSEIVNNKRQWGRYHSSETYMNKLAMVIKVLS